MNEGILNDYREARKNPKEYYKKNWQQMLLGYAVLGGIAVLAWKLAKKSAIKSLPQEN